MKRYKYLFWAVVVALPLVVTLTWFARSIYEEMFLWNGHFHVVNCTDHPIDVTIAFPSGKQHRFTLIVSGSHDFSEFRTGEGDIVVIVSGRSAERLDYVTSMNPMTVISINENNSQSSQVFR